jgi:hypothetical protein
VQPQEPRRLGFAEGEALGQGAAGLLQPEEGLLDHLRDEGLEDFRRNEKAGVL